MQTIYILNIMGEKTPPTEFCLFKYGENSAYHMGGNDETIEFYQEDAARFLLNNHNKKVMIDYDHGSLMAYSPNPAETSKAAGFGFLRLKEDGLYLCDIEWTPPAAEKLRNGEFQYMSPAYEEDKDGKMFKFINVAITNLPALRNNAEILNQRGINMADEKEMAELKAELAAMKLSNKQMNAQVEAANAKQKEIEVQSMVDEAVEAGKVGKAEKADYVAYGMEHGGEFLAKMLNKLTATLPRKQKFNAVEKTAQVEEKNEVVELSETKQAILRFLSAPGVDAKPLIKSEEDKIKFLNKLADPKKTIESSRFFNGWGFRGLNGRSGKGE